MNKHIKRFIGSVSPWFVIGLSAILVVLVLIVAFLNYDRERRHMGRLLKEKGATVIAAIEAGTRTGTMGVMDGSGKFQALLHEIALQPDILYLALVAPSGEILIHSDKKEMGKDFIAPQNGKVVGASAEPEWRIVQRPDFPKSFEVYKLFQPTLQMPRHLHTEKMASADRVKGQLPIGLVMEPKPLPTIVIGMGDSAFAEAIREDLILTLSTSGVLLFLGFGGLVSLFWLQSSARSKRLLQDNQALTLEVVANIPEGIIVCDLGGVITFVNPIAAQLLGFTTISLVGKASVDVLPQDMLALCTTIDKDKHVAEQELQLGGNGEDYLFVSVVTTKIITEGGTPVGHLFMIRDLSQEKQLQDALRRADRMAAIGHLAAGVAHEVRNPLSSIKGYATYFGSLFSEDSENRKAADIMTNEVDRLNRVISELLEVARPTDIVTRKTDFRALVDSSLRLVKQEATGAGVLIVSDIDAGIDMVNIDPDRITQALINLYINAIQSMPNGGELAVSALRQGADITLLVRDSGTGLKEDIHGRIFDPYFTTKKTGTGLGLAIVSKIIEAHGGAIIVESTSTKGTTFSITLPVQGRDE